jgi:hypothetical protein
LFLLVRTVPALMAAVAVHLQRFGPAVGAEGGLDTGWVRFVR